MATINLLPWRDKRREEQQKAFGKFCLYFALLGGIAAFGWSQMVASDIERQDQRNAMLKTEIKQLEAKVSEIRTLKKERDDLIARMEVIQGLQGNRPQIVHVFDKLVHTLPDGIHFSSLQRLGDNLVIKGTADSTSRIPVLMRRLDASCWFDQSRTPLIERSEGTTKTFTLNLKITPPDKVTEDGTNPSCVDATVKKSEEVAAL